MFTTQESMKKIQLYFSRHLDCMSHHYTSADSNRMTLAYFCISGLDLCKLEIKDSQRQNCLNWIYSQMVESTPNQMGFRGSPSLNIPHITMTYTALCCLLILKDDLNGIPKEAIIKELSSLQTDKGVYRPCLENPENDMRFLYCACCISYILQDWRGMDRSRAIDYIKKSKNYDGGYGQGPYLESHGGSTFCAIASLYLMDELHDVSSHTDTIQWLLNRQIIGFQGRVNKPADTCYSFWIGASLDMLNASCFINKEKLNAFLSTTVSSHGGFGKDAESYPDLMHSYMGISGLCILGDEEAMKSIYCPLGISMDAFKYLKSCQNPK